MEIFEPKLSGVLLPDSTVFRNLWVPVDSDLLDSDKSREFNSNYVINKNNKNAKWQFKRYEGKITYLSLLEEVAKMGMLVVIPEGIRQEIDVQYNIPVLENDNFRNYEFYPTFKEFCKKIAKSKLNGIIITPADPHAKLHPEFHNGNGKAETTNSYTYLSGLRKEYEKLASGEINLEKFIDYRMSKGKNMGETAIAEVIDDLSSGPAFFVSDDDEAFRQINKGEKNIPCLTTMGFIKALSENGILQKIGFKEGVEFDHIRQDINDKLKEVKSRYVNKLIKLDSRGALPFNFKGFLDRQIDPILSKNFDINNFRDFSSAREQTRF